MRTAEEVGRTIAQIQACNDATGSNLQRLILGVLRDYQDEAVAHGMTLSAEIVRTEELRRCGMSNMKPQETALTRLVLTARDNKVWRKE